MSSMQLCERNGAGKQAAKGCTQCFFQSHFSKKKLYSIDLLTTSMEDDVFLYKRRWLWKKHCARTRCGQSVEEQARGSKWTATWGSVHPRGSKWEAAAGKQEAKGCTHTCGPST